MSMSDIYFDENLTLRSGSCMVYLARYMLTLQPGDRIVTKSQLAKQYKVGVGTVQTALQRLEDIGGIRMNCRGHLGSFIESINIGILWKYSMYGYVRATMPLPHSDIFNGLAAGITSSWENQEGIMLQMSYVNGSRKRVKNLQAGLNDFIVCSMIDAKSAIAEDPDLHVYLELGPDTYMGDPAVLLREGVELTNGIRVGIDQASYDNKYLVQRAYQGLNVEFVPVNYNASSLFRVLRNKKIDSALWCRKDLPGRSFVGKVLLPDGFRDITEEAGTAVVLIHQKNREKMDAVHHFFNVEKIRKVQIDVISGEEIPDY